MFYCIVCDEAARGERTRNGPIQAQSYRLQLLNTTYSSFHSGFLFVLIFVFCISLTQCLHSSSSYLQFKAIFLSLFYIFISCIFISAFPLQDEEAGFCSRLLSKSQRAARVRLTLFPNANYFTFLIQRSSLLFIRRLRMSLGSIKCDESGLWQNVADQVFWLILFLESCPLEFKRQDLEIHT